MAAQLIHARLLEILKEWDGCHCFMVKRYFALRQLGKIRLRYAEITFLLHDKIEIEQFKVDTPSIKAGCELVSLDSAVMQEVYEQIKHDPVSIVVDGERLSPIEPMYPSALPPIAFNAWEDLDQMPRLAGTSLPQRRIPVFGFSTNENPLPSELSQYDLDLELAVADPPFQGMTDLRNALQGPEWLLSPSNNPHIRYIVTLPLEISFASSIKKDEAEIRILANPALKLSEICIGVKIYNHAIGKTNLLERRNLPNDSIVWSSDIDPAEGVLTLPLKDANAVLIILSYKNHFVQQYWLIDGHVYFNHRSKVHEILDQQQALRLALIETRSQNDFEQAVCILCNLRGMNPVLYGGIARLKEGVDIVAYAEPNYLYLIECSLGSPDHKGKLLKLRDRVANVRSVLAPLSWPNREILGVMVSQLPRSETQEHHSECANYGIALICREEIESFLEAIDLPLPQQEEIHKRFLSLIPRSSA